MRKRNLSLSMGAVLLLVICPPAHAQPEMVRPVRISVSDPRPLAMAAQELENRGGWVITYEDPQWLAASEIQDVTESVRRDGLSFPRVLVPKGGAIEFDVSPTALTLGGIDRTALAQRMVLAHNAAGNPGTFRVQASHGRLSIVPLTAKDPSGRPTQQHPILDTLISIEQRPRNGLDLIEAFAAQLSQTTGVKVNVGTIPLNLFFNTVTNNGAQDEPARDFLSRFLDQIGPGLSWRLFFDPGGRAYFLNIHRVNVEKH